MDFTTSRWTSSLADEAGVTAIEYGLMAGLIAVAIIGGVSATGISVGNLYVYWTNAVIAALAGAP